jgi:predicted Mrr-cat superfamily restriction endonuclease
MEFNSTEAIIIAMQSSQFSMEEKKEILIEYFKLMGYNQSTNNTSNENSTFKAD